MAESFVNTPERNTQTKVIQFFREDLHYNYLGNLTDQENQNIRDDDLRHFLINKMHYSELVARRAIADLQNDAANIQQGLYSANKEVYTRLKYPHPVLDENREPVGVRYIDFKNPANNIFAIAEEVTVNLGHHVKRPDLVIYINGIAVAVIELKKSSVSVADGIRQNLTNQNENFIQGFFSTIQLCLAGNESEGLRYGTIETDETHYLTWKQEAFREHINELDENDLLIEEKCKSLNGDKLYEGLYSIFHKERILDLIRNFVIFDNGRKKVCRYNQYFAIHRALNRINQKKGGIIWHTQGSGKSLTMVWLSKKLLDGYCNRRILIVTDREELDDQIEKLFLGVGENIKRAKSGRDLINRINSTEGRLICSLVHKFGQRGGEVKPDDYEKYIQELKGSLPPDFKVKGDFIVFVDECHRTQSGLLHKAMKAILPNAIFVGFTGTPLLKKDKQSSIKVFGNYIHCYKFDEAVRDHVILDLLYEGRDIPQDLQSEEKIDEWFALKTRGLNESAKAKLKNKWATLKKVYSSRNRLERIVEDIIFDFEKDPRLSEGRGNAILVADRIYTACKFYELFLAAGFKKCAIISSYTPHSSDLRTDTVSTDEDTEKFNQYQIYRKMIGIDDGEDDSYMEQKVESFEKEAKRKFVKEPANMKLLIVIDKLLTGFDAPPCTYLYLDKNMQDHGLFQAICRVNRLDDESKPFGVIIDYKNNFENVADSMAKYTSPAFDGYDESDVAEIVKDRAIESAKKFNTVLEELDTLCEDVEQPRERLEFEHFFCGCSGEQVDNDALARLRERFYTLVRKLARAFADLKAQQPMLHYTEAEWAKKRIRTEFYCQLSQNIQMSSGDYVDLKAYEPGMRHLFDTYIAAKATKTLIKLNDATLLDIIDLCKPDLDSSKKKDRQIAAETIENNIRKKIVAKINVNPTYYNRMSEILSELIEQRKQEISSYTELIQRYIELAIMVNQPHSGTNYPESVKDSDAKCAIYDNCGKDADLANRLYNAVIDNKQDGFRNNDIKARNIKRALFDILQDDAEVERLYSLICQQAEF